MKDSIDKKGIRQNKEQKKCHLEKKKKFFTYMELLDIGIPYPQYIYVPLVQRLVWSDLLS